MMHSVSFAFAVKVECPEPFIRIEGLQGCYHAVLEEGKWLPWDAAKTACEGLHPSSHLVAFDTDKVCIFLV